MGRMADIGSAFVSRTIKKLHIHRRHCQTLTVVTSLEARGVGASNPYVLEEPRGPYIAYAALAGGTAAAISDFGLSGALATC